MTPPVRMFTVSRAARNRHLLYGSEQAAGLQLSGWQARAQAWVASDHYEVERSGVIRRRAIARRTGDDQPLVSLGRQSCIVPIGAAGVWKVRAGWRGYHAALRVDGLGEILLRTTSQGRLDVSVRGQWPERDLVILTAAFALLVRRRDDAAAAGSTAVTIVTTSG